jgi:hypothetical protein
VLSGRLKAIPVATLAAIILIGTLGPAVTVAADPPGLARFMTAIGRVESGGNYSARNATSGAIGKYQIMPSNWRAWSRIYLGNPYARPTPTNQDKVAAAKMRALFRWLGSWRRVAYWWLTGSNRSSGWSYPATRYVTKVMAHYKRATTRPAPVATTPLHRYPETSPSIVYSGAWKQATHRGYQGDGARYSTSAGATAQFTFTGSKVVWYGPVGPTRGQARVSIDGTYVKTVNLYRSAFRSRLAVFARSWATAGEHVLTIQVVGTRGHPFVAIDELTVAE